MVKKGKGGLLQFGGREINRQELGELGQGQAEVGVVNTDREDAAIWLLKSNVGLGQAMRTYWFSHGMTP